MSASGLGPEVAAERRALRVVTWLALLGVALQMWRFTDAEFAVDDAWISFRIARNWLTAGVPTFNLSSPPVEGMTNLLWTLLSMGWIKLAPDTDPIVFGRLVGAGLHLGTIAVLIRLSARLGPTFGARAVPSALATAAVLIAPGWLAYHALSGLETALYGFLFSIAVERLQAFSQGEARSRVGWAAGLALGLLGATRPEGVLVAGLLAAAVLARGDLRRRSAPVLVPIVAIVGLVEAFRWHAYGALVPNTFYAKPPDALGGGKYFLLYLVYGLGVAGVVPVVLAAARSRFARDLLWVLGVLSAATLLSGGDWMPGFRRYTLVTLGLAVLAATAGVRGGRVALAALGCWVGANLLFSLRGEDGRRFATLEMTQLGQRAARTPGVRSVALGDIGAFGWNFPGDVLDIYGLVDRHIATRPGLYGHKAWDEAYFLAQRPELIIVRVVTGSLTRDSGPATSTTERPLLDAARRSGEYLPHVALPMADRTWSLVVFHRKDVVMPPPVWGPPTALNLEAFRSRPFGQ